MSGNLGEAVFDLTLDAGPLDKGMKQARSDVNDAASGMQKDLDRHGKGLTGILSGVGNVAGTVLKAGLLAGAAGATALVGALGGCVMAAMGAQQTEEQLNAVLRSTKGAAGMSKDALVGLADSLSKVTTFEDDAIIAGESLLLTFTNIGKDVFPDATEAMLDMSQALGQDMKSSAVQLGKALNDPIAGISALSRVGVSFTEAQKEQIKAMVEAGNVAGAQKLILKELQTEFGGSAKAAGTTFSGQLTILKNSLGNVAETIGGALLPGLTTVTTRLATTLNSPAVQSAISGFATALGKLFSGDVQGAIASVSAGLMGIFGADKAVQIYQFLTGLKDAISNAFTFIQTNVVPILQQAFAFITTQVIPPLVAAFQAIVAWVTANWPMISATIKAVFDAVMLAAQWLMTNVIPPLIAIFQACVAWVTANWPMISATIKTVIDTISTIITTVMTAVQTFWAQNGAAILAKALEIWNQVQGLIGAVVSWVQNAVTTVMNIVTALWREKHDTIMGIAQTVWGIIENTVRTVTGVIQGVIKLFTDLLRGDWSAAWEDIKGIIVTVWEGIKTQIGLAIDLVKGIIDVALSTLKIMFRDKWEEIKGVIVGKWEDIKTSVTDAVDNVRIAIGEGWNTIYEKAKEAWKTIKGWIAEIWAGIRDRVRQDVEAVRIAIGTEWNKIFMAAQSAWQTIKSAITDPIEEALGVVQRVVGIMKSALEGLGKIHIPMPHFTAGTKWVSVAGIGFEIPDIGIQWYGGGLSPTLFTEPTLIGVGERGPETVSVTPAGSSASQAGGSGTIGDVTVQDFGMAARLVLASLVTAPSQASTGDLLRQMKWLTDSGG